MDTQDQHHDRSKTLTSSAQSTLRLVPALTAPRGPRGGFLLTRKFIDGLHAYRQRWPGPLSVHLVQQPHRDRHMDELELLHDDAPAALHWFDPLDVAGYRALFDDAAVLLVTLVDRNLDLIDAAVRHQVPVVLVTEQSRRTRSDIIRAQNPNPVLRWRRQWWSSRIERRYVEAVSRATGVQCNGTPTFDAYKPISANPLLYFDSRLTESMLPSPRTIDARLQHLRSAPPLRLAFSGRLVSIKGVDDLPLVAATLDQLGVQYTMDIIGAGEHDFERALHQKIRALGVGDRVRLRGVMAFEDELIPHLAANVDLFVCCHRQGDPSCTYLETLGCGVPIVGYDNEAWTGVLEHSHAGWLSPMNQPESLAHRVAALDEDRQQIVDAAAKAREFALQHTFERTMDRRARHLSQCANLKAVEVCA